MKTPSTLAALALGLSLSVGTAQAQPQEKDDKPPVAEAVDARALAMDRSLAHVDEDAPVVLSFVPGALDELMPLVNELLAPFGVSSTAAALGAAGLLGFQPLSGEGWKSVGVKVDEPALLQLGAISNSDMEATTIGWRSRLIMPVADPALVRQTLSAMRIGDSLRVEEASNGEITFFFQRPGREATKTRRLLKKAGVFLMVKPDFTPFWISAAERDSQLVIDLILPWKTGANPFAGPASEWMPLLSRQPKALSHTSPGVSPLVGADLGLLLRSDALGRSFAMHERYAAARVGVSSQDRCAGFEELAKQSHVQAMGLGLAVDKDQLDGEFRVQLRKRGALDTQLRENVVDLAWPDDDKVLLKARADFMPMLFALGLERRKGVLATYDSLRKGIKQCGTHALPLSLALAWPRVLGMWLSELASLDPKGRRLMDSLVGARLVLLEDPAKKEPFLAYAETMVSGSGSKIAYEWLDLLFGYRKDDKGAITWGRGPLRPYSVHRISTLKGYATAGYSMLGVAYGEGAQAAGIASKRVKDFEGGPVALVANPSELAAHLPGLPLASLWRRWRSLRIESTRDPQGMSFSIEARP